MPGFDVSVNVISLFAFILVLGIVVDDAIIVGENIYRHQEKHGQGLRGAIEGAREIGKPVRPASTSSRRSKPISCRRRVTMPQGDSRRGDGV